MAYLWLLRNSKEAVTLWAWGAQRPGASSTGNPLSLGFQSERAASRLAHGFPLGPRKNLHPGAGAHCKCHSSLNHTGVYLVKQDRMLLHLEFPWVSIASDASPREQLRYYREYRGLLRRELGDMTGMSETTILNYELGYMPIAYDKAKRLAKALEIDEKLLFDDYCRFLDYPFQLRCKELRLELGLTQVEIADKAGIARGTYGTWECAAVRPGREPFQKFAAFITSQGKEVV